MRAYLPLAVAAMLLSGCHRDADTSNLATVDENSATAAIGMTNDVTSIDAADADAANMATDLPPDEIPNLAADQAASAAKANSASNNSAAATRHAQRRAATAGPADAGNSSNSAAPAPTPAPADTLAPLPSAPATPPGNGQ